MPEKRGFPTFPLFFYQQYIHQNSLSPFDSPGEEGELKHKMLCREYCLFLISQKNISLIALKVIDSGLQGHSGKISPFIGLKYLNTPPAPDYSHIFCPSEVAAFGKGGWDFAKNLQRAWTRVRLMENAAEHKTSQVCQIFTAQPSLHWMHLAEAS